MNLTFFFLNKHKYAFCNKFCIKNNTIYKEKINYQLIRFKNVDKYLYHFFISFLSSKYISLVT